MYSLKMEGYEKIYQKIKIEEEKKLNEPLSYYSMNRIIFEDNENKSIKVYDSTLFDGMSTFKIEKVEQLKDIKGLEVLKPQEGALNSWYALIIKYKPEIMNNVSRERFVEAVVVEGAVEVDIPNSTCPVNYLELFKYPDLLFDGYKNNVRYSENDFENATKFYNSIIKLPVWETEEDEEIVYKYIRAIKKVANNIKEL